MNKTSCYIIILLVLTLPCRAWEPDGWVHFVSSGPSKHYAYSWEELSWFYPDPAGMLWVYDYAQERWQPLFESAVGSTWSYWHWPFVWAEGTWYYSRSAGVQWVYDFRNEAWSEWGRRLPSQVLPGIKDYYPRSGAAGSTVYLHFEEPITDFARKLRVLYNDAEIPVLRSGEYVAAVRIPTDAGSGDMICVAGRTQSVPLAFTVLDRETTPLLNEMIAPAAEERTFMVGDEISVTVPAGMLADSALLSLSRVAHVPASDINPFGHMNAYEVSLGGIEELDGLLEIGMRYDPTLLNPDYPVDMQLIALRWDEDLGEWIALPQRVDAETEYIFAYTDHLSLFGFLTLGAARSMAASWAAEKVLNDVYVTPMGNFRILYSRSAMDSNPLLTDFWQQNRPEFNLSYQTKYPQYIQDIGHLFEVALANFRSANFKTPQTWGYFTSWRWTNPITVKIDSYWSKIIGIGTRDPQYEKIWQNIHLPTVELMDYRGQKSSYAVIGHELFHRIQAEYYGRTGFMRSSNHWWIEATAEYAGSRAAWVEKLNYLHRGIGSNFLSHSITTTGAKWGEKLYEYAASVFVQFLVEVKGLDFQDIVATVATGEPIARLSELISSENTAYLKDYYAEFAAWAVFSHNSFLRSYPIADFSKPDRVPNEIAEAKDMLTIAAGDELIIEVSGGNPVFVDMFRLGEGERVAANTFPYPLERLTGGQTGRYATAKAGDVFYFLAVNPGGSDLSTEVRVRVNKDEGPEVSHTFDLRRQYSAKLWAIRLLDDPVLSVVPEEVAAIRAEQEIAFTFKADFLPVGIEWVYFDWDFGDLQHNSKGKSSRLAVVVDGPTGQGKVQHEVSHAFAPDKGEYTALVILRDYDSNRELARATVSVTLYQVRIEGGVRHYIYELPPGVRELEHAFQASASPEGNYRFEWDFGDGHGITENKGPGERSSVTHTYTQLKNEDAFHPRVRLRDEQGNLLAEDQIHIKVFEEVWDPGRPLLTAVDPEAAPVGSGVRIIGEHLPTFSDFRNHRGRIEIGGIEVAYDWLELGERTPDGEFPVLWINVRVPEFNALYGDVVVHLNDKSSNPVALKTSLGRSGYYEPLMWSGTGKIVRAGQIRPQYLSSYHEPLTIEWFRDGVLVETGLYFSNRDEAASTPSQSVYHDYTHITVVVTDALGRVFTATHTYGTL